MNKILRDSKGQFKGSTGFGKTKVPTESKPTPPVTVSSSRGNHSLDSLDYKVSVHVTHCCAIHGCKYGSPDCPVRTGQYEQKYPCEQCPYEHGSLYDNDIVPTAAELALVEHLESENF